MPPPEPKNKCLDCLGMKLEGMLIPPNKQKRKFWQKPSKMPQINLYLTIQFNQQWEELLEGRVKFGLKGGVLRLHLQHGNIPYEFRELGGYIQLATVGNQQQQGPSCDLNHRPTDPNGNRERGGGNVTPEATQSQSHETSQLEYQPESCKTSHETDQVSWCHITNQVSAENPAWIFEEQKGNGVLFGSLNRVKLATVNVTALPCRIQAIFEVSQRDICLTEVEGLWSSNLTRNKTVVLNRLIVEHLLVTRLKPYLSLMELQYG
ncbi:hypothetical protein LYNGBM3L_22750 [Moorena producens 3L]|uniref:Uncharacterized protein n=2 Tax=Coleofasciculaceae TaxID=1892251 RepID=F4XMT3_9CYAN|nr:hypothetical protein LYNGBM3L_22750 [Moorena producens 3L]NER85660.1 hypothetical protein [Moorena sp. SIO3A2]OLT64981.1 hypothetical protein BI334_08005 [Moorena producens 3L]